MLLEAGSGAHSYIRLPENVYIVGIDISEEQLSKNTVVNEKILADIQDYRFEDARFDVIICWTVLEHLQKPMKALDSFVRSIKDDGIIILAVPNVFSIPGLVAKCTPHRFQVWAWRSLLGHKGYTPFRTYLRFSISPTAIRRFASRNGLSVEYSRLYEPMDVRGFRQRNAIVNLAWCSIVGIVGLLSFAKVDAGLSEHIVVLKRNRPTS
jgi:ubiquinone/menaquinone biosynthesis C-methylase UbiE